MVGPPPVASSTACAATKRKSPVRTSIMSTPASAPSAAGMSATARCSSRRRIGRAQTCSINRLMISMPVRSPLVHGAVEALPGEGLAVQRPVRVAIEEAADLVLQLAHALDRRAHQRPSQLLMRQPFAALDGVHEMPLDRVARIERDVVAALHHARATA